MRCCKGEQTITENDCKVFGTAPFCDVENCPDGWTFHSQTPGGGEDDGLKCWTGEKLRCCKGEQNITENDCKVFGTAPFCAVENCPDGWTFHSQTPGGGEDDGLKCWTGKKLRCCKGKQMKW